MRTRSVLGITVAMVLGSVAAAAQPAGENARCLNCHGSLATAQRPAHERATMVRPVPGHEPRADAEGIYVSAEAYGRSVHRDTLCTDCHADCETLPHAVRTEPARCGPCHEPEVTAHAGSVHGQALAGGDAEAAECRDCHGTHDILSSQDPDARTYKLRLPFTCAACHTNAELMEATHVHQPQAAEQYIESMHGKGLLTKGLIIAPSCNDCHGVHNIWPATDPRSAIHRHNIPHTCGTCHAGLQRDYDRSSHGRAHAAGDPRAPTCSDCHTAHDIDPPEGIAFKLHSDERCGRCHGDRLERYRETFHGKAMALGLPSVAGCHDCHGPHKTLPVDDPESQLHPANRLAVCQKCHPGAGERFTSYIAHADHSDRANYPALYWTFLFMTLLVVGTFAFFGVHTMLWIVRSFVLYFRDPQAFRDIKAKLHKDDTVYVRFPPFERFLHALVIISFLLLVATGMPLKFYYTHWAQVMVRLFGGLEVTTYLHRVGAVITFAYMGLHILSMLQRGWHYRDRYRDPKTRRYSVQQFLRVVFGPEIPVPNLNDVRDWWAHQKWFFGRGPRPQFDRWTYWEKFDYMAVFWGVAIIGASGLIMWFPVTFTQFLPGWVINIALIVHSDEALLAAGFIFTFHFFNGHFRLEKFPMDTIIFSGRITRAEMLHERRRWYDRLATAGKLDAMRLGDEWGQWKRVIGPLGFGAFVIGVVLLVLIFVAMGTRLLGH